MQLSNNQAMKQYHFNVIALGALLAATILLSCQKDPQDPTQPVPVPQQPNPLPENALVEKIKWSENDHYTIAYNDRHQPVKVINQWQYVQNDPTKIRTIEYDFQYNQQGLLEQVNQTGGFKVRYFYQNGLIQKTQELYPGGAPANQTEYLYDQNRIVQENFTVYSNTGAQEAYYQTFLKYDAKGNLIQEEMVERQDNMTFKFLSKKNFSNFDQQVNPTHWLMRYPFLPQVRWQFNNPGKEIRSFDNTPSTTTHFIYEYDAQGLPVKRTEIKPLSTLTADLEYQ
jgi:hypothetical protein